MKIKKSVILKLLIIFLLFSNNLLFSINLNDKNIMSNLNFDKQYLLPDEYDKSFNLLTKYFDDNIYVFHLPQKLSKSDEIFHINKLNNHGIKKIYFTIPSNDWIFNFTISDENLYILCQFHIFIYKIMDDTTLYKKKINLNELYQEITIDNQNILLFNSCYNCINR